MSQTITVTHKNVHTFVGEYSFTVDYNMTGKELRQYLLCEVKTLYKDDDFLEVYWSNDSYKYVPFYSNTPQPRGEFFLSNHFLKNKQTLKEQNMPTSICITQVRE